MDPFVIYVSGLFDGEGSVSISKTPPQKNTTSKLPRYRVQCIIGMVDPQALQKIHARWGGSIRYRINPRPNQRNSWYWAISSRKARAFLESILPYLLIKQRIAEVAVELQTHLTASYGYRNGPGRGFNCLPFDETVTLRDALYEEARALNRRGMF